MATDRHDNIGNAAEIIDCFGGIRPMASKIGVAVTTIQGWKQRNSIPSGRREELIAAAKVHEIDLGTLLDEPVIAEQEETVAFAEKEIRVSAKAAVDREDSVPLLPHSAPQSPVVTLIIAGVLIMAAAAIGVVFAVAPKVTELTEQDQRIAELEQEVEAMRVAQSSQKLLPKESALWALPDEYKNSLAQLQNKVGELAAQGQSYQNVLDGLQQDIQNGAIQQRVAKVESQITAMVSQAKAMGLQDMMDKLHMMQQSPEGMGQLGDVVGSLVQTLNMPAGAEEISVDTALQTLRERDPKVAETFKDVAPEDMKAAAMLVAMAQLRQSLARDHDSFDQDLMLLKQTLAKDDPALLEAIDRLSPKAKNGVLTPDGLSQELRSLSGEIVSASLAGESVSIEDKALARFGSLVKVEKDGQQISGTQTQIYVSEAQKLLDQGDIEGAVAVLQKIEGPASHTTQPLIDQAQATLMARQVQDLLGKNLLFKLKSLGRGHVPYTSSGGIGSSLESMGNQFKSFSTGGR